MLRTLKNKAFSIIELLVVIVIIIVIVVIAYPQISNYLTDREVKKEVYDTIAFIKERKAEVTSGKYGMTQIVLKPNLEVYTMSPQNFLILIKIFRQIVLINLIDNVIMDIDNQVL